MNSELSQEALIALFYEAWAFRDVQFQTWLAITFAVIVAIYITAPSISKFLRILLGITYVTSSVITLAGWLTLAAHAGEYATILKDTYSFSFPNLFPWIAPTLVILMTTVTIGTTVFIAMYRREG